MSAGTPPRAERRTTQIQERRQERRRTLARERDGERQRERAGKLAFGAVILAVLAVGGYLAFGDFIGRGGTAEGTISVQASMAGFTPSEIRVKAGEVVTLDFWTQDSAAHLDGGVHTLISDELGLYATLPGADVASTSRVSVGFMAPSQPGAYDIYCDTCCGGRATPTMHGTLIVEA